jgi:hypothetical protein
MLSLPVNFVKFSIGSKRSPLLAVAVVSVIAIMLAVSVFVAKSSSAHGVNPARKKQQGCCGDEPAISRRMIGTYYTTEDGFQSTLVLNNKGPNQIMITPILHSQTGQTFTASPVAVGGLSSSEVDLNLLARVAGPQFYSGSFEFTYEGGLLEVGGGLRIVKAEKSLIFDEQMLEPGMKFPSSRLEAVYAVPFEDSQVSVIVTNTTPQPIIVKGAAIFAEAEGHHPIQGQIGPYQTQVVNLPHGLVKKASAGAVSLSHDGGKGALLAIIHLQDADRGYSETVNFTNPSGKTTERHGAGLRLGSVNHDPLRAVVAVRNIGDSATTVTATVPYSKQNGDTGTIALPQVSLAPGEIKLLNTSSPQLGRDDFDTAGLEIKYTGAPGSVIASASSVSRSGNHVFTLPMKDPQGGLSSTGGYPWFINGSASTVVFIKNTTNEPRTFTINLVYAGGQWGSGLKAIAPGQTFKLDVRKVRDSQMKGSEGNAMSLDAVSGHVSWSVRGKQGKKTLIGRAQMVDFSNGLASTYECQLCCPRSFYDSRLAPGGLIGYPGYQEQFLAQERTRDCHGNIWPWDGASGGTAFSSDDWNVADVSFGGLCTAIAPGSTTIRASWNSFSYFMDPDGFCLEEPVPTEPTASCDVALPTVTITEVTIDNLELGTGQTTTLRATIASGAGAAGLSGTVYFYRSRGATGATISPASKPINYGSTQTFEATITRSSEGTTGDIYFTVEVDGDTSKLSFQNKTRESPKLTLK